ncbi:uncharacterized protein LOC141653264 [Silene latifolia]|uniref:uncharacterized protein LOC141653264 n=1 Tax=Silene latifolia TaxID=37657 RepID=UPI003D785365
MTKKPTNLHLNSKQSKNKSSISSAIQSEKSKFLGKPDVEEGQKMKSIHEVTGIPTLDINDGLVEDCDDESESGDENNQDDTWYQIHGKKIIQIMDDEPELLQLTEDDVQSELDYWQQAVMGFVVGTNPPWQILKGLLKRIWNKYVIDKISFLPNGVFLARFQTEEMKQSVLGSGYFVFDNKPLIIKPWQPDLQLTKENIKAVPAWIRMQNLPLKFWGKSLPKIANLIGHYVKSDPSTELKTRLGFARVMVELKLGQAFPKSIKFLDEKKQEVTIYIVYEWKPSLCTKCKQLGHEKDQCRKGKNIAKPPIPQKVWRPVKKSAGPIIQTAPSVATITVTENAVGIVPAVQPDISGSPVTKNIEVEVDTLRTPDTRIPVSTSGTLSPVRHPRQGSGQVSRKVASSPHCMGQLKKNCSPTIGIGVNDWGVSTNNAHHKGGRVWVIWKLHLFDIQFLHYDAQFIHLHVTNKITQMQFYYTVIYAFNGIGERQTLWLGENVTEAESEPFYDSLHECGLMDIPSTGAYYTWNNKQPPDTRVYSRLDKFLGNHDWLVAFPEFMANFLHEGHFDHSPCLVSKGAKVGNQNRPFKYFNMWSSATGFKECVSKVWQQWVYGTKMYRVVRKLKLLKPELKKINKDHFSDIENSADIAQISLKQIQEQLINNPGDKDLMFKEYEAHQRFNTLFAAKMEFLKQKAKAHWLKDGDSNIAYFHGVIKAIRNKNFLCQINDHWDKNHSDQEGIQNAFLGYYQMLLGSNAPTIRVNKTIGRQGKICSDDHRDILLAPVTKEEVKDVIFHIPNDKAPGQDGYSSKFFKDSWDIVGEEVNEAIMDLFQSGSLLMQINATMVTLIPKTARPTSFLQYRPIACCNIIYKCISKLLCNRLTRILPDLIAQNQGGFIQGRSIMENILICQDIIRLYERKAVSPRCLLKMDLQKAYDTIECEFLDQMLSALNLPDQFKGWKMQCVTSATYSLNLNGNVFGFFKGKRGLRQGDPLSPLLFTVCMEYRSRLLTYSSANNEYNYHPMCKQMKLTHLIFADDLLLFCKGDACSMMTILRTFVTFSKTSGLNMSKGKSNAYFNGVKNSLKQEILLISGMVEGSLPFKYLGVPIKTTRLTTKDCKPLIDKIVQRIRNLGARKLSYAGRLTLVQSVLMSLHNYWAGIFILPTGVINKIEAICRHFLWDGGVDYLRSPLVSWEKICKPKQEGGLGLKSAIHWDRAAVGKMVWWLASKSDLLWVKWVNNSFRNPISRTYGLWIREKNTPCIAKGYDLIRKKGEKIQWQGLVWNKYTIPKHGFLTLIYFHKGRNTKEKLYKLGITEDDTCGICGYGSESSSHLFFDCEYGSRVISSLGSRIGEKFPHYGTIEWRLKLTGTGTRKGIINALYNACIYYIWT